MLDRLLLGLFLIALSPGSIMGALVLMRVIRGFKNAEATGLSAVAGGIVEANDFVLISILISIGIGLVSAGFAIVRLVRHDALTLPPGWLLFLAAAFALAPLFAFINAQELLIVGIIEGGNGVIVGEQAVQRWLVIAIIGAAVAGLIVILGFVRCRSDAHSSRRLGLLATIVTIEIVLVAMGFSIRSRSGRLIQNWMDPTVARVTQRF